MSRFAAGTLLGERFEVHGEVGRGGTAVVLLTTDRLRGERVALKVVHDHLASDPAARRRLQREVATAGLLRSPAALVPYDLHEFEGLLALSMPFHPGETLAERVATGGALPAEQVRALGIRIATALADAHRTGVLHRDVTANNVLVTDVTEEAVLTDFGLSRLVGNTRSTGLLGTAGYAAPEVYAGHRADPRSDLYGLGAVLYLALTGKPAFSATDPVHALKQQLDGDVTPVRKLAPSCPEDLAQTVQALLNPDPDGRPQGARDVVEALRLKEAAATLPTANPARTLALPSGTHAVLVKERSSDRSRRKRLRRQARSTAPTFEDEVVQWGTALAERVRGALGLPESSDHSPEAALVAAVAHAGGVPPDSLTPGPAILEQRFVLVEGTDAKTARDLAQQAKDAGFEARAVEVIDADLPLWVPLLNAVLVTGIVYGAVRSQPMVMWLCIAALSALTAFRGRVGGTSRIRRSSLEKRPVVFRASSTVAPTVAASTTKTSARATHPLADRAARALASLVATVDAAELPDIARRDLRDTATELIGRAEALAADLLVIEAEITSAEALDTSVVHGRLNRLQTLRTAGESVDEGELTRLQRALDEADQADAAMARLESAGAAHSAELVEIASTANRVRRDLLAEAEPAKSADKHVERLKRESAAALDARREAGQRQARSRQPQ